MPTPGEQKNRALRGSSTRSQLPKGQAAAVWSGSTVSDLGLIWSSICSSPLPPSSSPSGWLIGLVSLGELLGSAISNMEECDVDGFCLLKASPQPSPTTPCWTCVAITVSHPSAGLSAEKQRKAQRSSLSRTDLPRVHLWLDAVLVSRSVLKGASLSTVNCLH